MIITAERQGMYYIHRSRVFRRLNMLPVSHFQNLDLTMEVAQIRAEDGTFQKCTINNTGDNPYAGSGDAFPVCLQRRENFFNFLLDFHSLVLTLSLILFMSGILSKF